MAWMGFPLRGREGFKTLPKRKRDSGKKDCWKEDAPKPAVAQRAGGINPLLIRQSSSSNRGIVPIRLPLFIKFLANLDTR